ncbi:hypothetical protein ACS0TY_003587 [Phlomoides rotata]
MKLLSYNIPGLGMKAKRKEIRECVTKLKIEMCCIQESKMEKIDGRLYRSLWGEGNFDWASLDDEGNS